MKNKILVTGANGQLGNEFRSIAKSSPSVFIFTDIDTLDLTKKEDAIRFFKSKSPDIIINCAAYTAVDKAETDRDRAESINYTIPANLAEYSDESGCRIIHISTDYVFSGRHYKPLTEADETGPDSIYGQTKLKGEQALSNCKNALIIRTSWLYSTFGNNFLKSMIRLIGEREELRVVYDQIGTPTYAGDLAHTIISIVEKGDAGFLPGIYHYSNEGVASWYDFAFEIRELMGASCKIHPVETKEYPLPAPRPAYSILSKENIKKQFDLEIPHWKSSLKKCFDKISE